MPQSLQPRRLTSYAEVVAELEQIANRLYRVSGQFEDLAELAE